MAPLASASRFRGGRACRHCQTQTIAVASSYAVVVAGPPPVAVHGSGEGHQCAPADRLGWSRFASDASRTAISRACSRRPTYYRWLATTRLFPPDLHIALACSRHRYDRCRWESRGHCAEMSLCLTDIRQSPGSLNPKIVPVTGSSAGLALARQWVSKRRRLTQPAIWEGHIDVTRKRLAISSCTYFEREVGSR